MALGSVLGGIAGGALDFLSADEQADAMEDASQRQAQLQREQFEYARDLQEGLLAQQEPRREASQRAMRSLSMMLGLGDPGASLSYSDSKRLENLKSQIADEEKYKSTYDLSDFEKVQLRPSPGDNPEMGYVRRDQVIDGVVGQRARPGAETFTLDEILQGVDPSEEVNPEWERLNQEISQIESQLEGGDDFQGPRDVTETPGYQFMRDQGLDALASSGAARGMQLSGRQMEESQRFGQGLASQYRSQLMNELMGMAGMRPSSTATTNLASTAMTQGQLMGQNALQQGAIQAAGAGGTYGALGGMLSNTDWSGLGDMFSSGGQAGIGGGSPYGVTAPQSGATLGIPMGGGGKM